MDTMKVRVHYIFCTIYSFSTHSMYEYLTAVSVYLLSQQQCLALQLVRLGMMHYDGLGGLIQRTLRGGREGRRAERGEGQIASRIRARGNGTRTR